MNRDETVLRLVEKIFALEDQYVEQLEEIADLRKALKKANADLASDAVIKKEPGIVDPDKEYRFHLQVGGDFVCGFCGYSHQRVGDMKAHIRDNH